MIRNQNKSPQIHPHTERTRFQTKTSRSIEFVCQLTSPWHSSNVSSTQQLGTRLRIKQNYKDKEFSQSNNMQKNINQGIGNRNIGMVTQKGCREQILSKASSQVHKLSQSNRLKSQIKIKNEQMCFRFKLKLIALLRRISIKNQQIQKFQSLQPEQFLINFYNKISQYYKENQQQNKKLRQKYQAILQTLKYKNEQHDKLMQKNKQIVQEASKYVKLIKQQNKIIANKQKQINRLLFQIQSNNKTFLEFQQKEKAYCHHYRDLFSKMQAISGQSYRKQVQIQELEKLLNFNKQENQMLIQKYNILQFTSSKQKQQMGRLIVKLSKEDCPAISSDYSHFTRIQAQQNHQFDQNSLRKQSEKQFEQTPSDAYRQQFMEKIKGLVQQWKNHLCNTVNQYQKMLEECSLETNRKDEEIKNLKNIIQTYINSKLDK